jgi:hypothetical protein
MMEARSPNAKQAPELSVVVPTRPGIADWWSQAVRSVEGDVEILIVHPPGAARLDIPDPRIIELVSPVRGEVVQRLTGLLSARGRFLLSLNCDESVHPRIIQLARAYFARFPGSWVLRLSQEPHPFGSVEALTRPWPALPDLSGLPEAETETRFHRDADCLMRVPIAPMDKAVDWRSLVRGRRNHHGPHMENFDKRVWRGDIVRPALEDLTRMLRLAGPFKYLPFWTLDRLLGLYVQAFHYERGLSIGHWLPLPDAQIRMEDNPPQESRRGRVYLAAEILLLRRFPRYGYLWDLALGHLYALAREAARALRPPRKSDGGLGGRRTDRRQ